MKIHKINIIMLIVSLLLVSLTACGNTKSHLSFSNTKVGDTIHLGHYNQDNNSENGVDEIEWVVLTVQDNKALVVSKLALDCRAYHSS